MSSTSAKLMSAIHIRDFVDEVVPDRNRPDDTNYVEIHADVNIFQEEDFYDSRITVEPIHCYIYAYLTLSDRELYKTNAFFYADGRFVTTVVEDKLQITIQALSLQRHPGNVDDFNEYRRHLPTQWCPMVTVIGFVGHSDDETTEQFQCRYFELRTSVYNSPKTGHIDFTINCYFGSGRRWAKVRMPPSGSFVAVTAKVAGRIASDNRLAVRVLDMSYLPKSTSTLTSTPTLTPGSSKKQIDRWSRSAESSTPSKRIRHSSPKKSSDPEVQHPQTPHMIESDVDQQLSTPSKRIRRSSPKKSPSPEVQLPQTPHMIEKELDKQLSTTLEEDSDADNRDMPSTRSTPSQPPEHPSQPPEQSQRSRRKAKAIKTLK